MKLALFTVSYSGIWYKGDYLSLKEQIDKAKELGFDAISIEAKRPVAAPFDLTNNEIEEVKEYANDQNIEICAIESMSDFSSPVMEERENNLAMMKSLIEMTDKFDVKTLKVFAAWPGVRWEPGKTGKYENFDPPSGPMGPDHIEKWQRAKKGISEVADWAENYGINIALQNHPPLLRPGYEDTLSMVEEVGKENLKMCLDVPLFYERQSDDYVKEAVEACSDYIALTHYGAWNIKKTENREIIQEKASLAGKKINYETFLKELKRIGYDGYLVHEFCLPAIENHEIKGIDKIDESSKMAVEYMRNLIDSI